MAIEHANTVLDWQENLTDDEMPPEWMWHLDSELSSWFDEVKRKRDDRYGGGDRDDDRPTTVPLMENELAKGRR